MQDRAPTAPESGEDLINLGAILNTLWRGKFLIIFVTLLVTLAGGYYAYFSATPTYRATAVLMLNNREEQVVGLDSVIGGLGADATVVNTETQVLKSRSLLGKVVDTLDLQDSPAFNSSLKPPSFVDELKTKARTMLRGETATVERTPEEIRLRNRERAIDGLLGKLDVRNVPSSLVFQVSIVSADPNVAAQVSNAVVETYILNQLDVKFEATEKATSWLSDRVAELQVTLEAAEGEVQDFQSKTSLVNSETLLALEAQLKTNRDLVAERKAETEQLESTLAALRAAQTPQEQAAIAQDLQLERLLPRISEPSVATAFETQLERIIARRALDIERNQTQIASLEESLVDLRDQVREQNEDLIVLQQLQREAEASRLLYEHFLSRLKETSVQQGIHQADSRVLSAAVVPTRLHAPRKSLILAMSMVMGALIGAGIVLGIEARQNGFRDSNTVERVTGLSVMGNIPVIPSKTRKGSIQYLIDKPTSVVAEAVRNLRTSIILSNLDTPPQVIMFSSSLPGEGKTTVSIAMAQNMAGLGKKVLLIEGDQRRRIFREYASAQPETGMMSYLSGNSSLQDVVVKHEEYGVDMLVGVEQVANTADLFSSERFKEMMADARSQYDTIVIDTPPVLLVPDARIISRLVDATNLVVKWDSTSKAQVLEALREFETVGSKVNGIVLNQINIKRMNRYSYYGGYSSYQNYNSGYFSN